MKRHLLSVQNRMRKRKGAMAIEYIIVFPMFVFLMVLMVILLMMVMNIMKYNDIATNIANNANFSPSTYVSGSNTCVSGSGGTNEISNQCSQFVDSSYDADYVFKSPYTTVDRIMTTQYKDRVPTSQVSDGVMMYVEIYYNVMGFDFRSVGVAVIF